MKTCFGDALAILLIVHDNQYVNAIIVLQVVVLNPPLAISDDVRQSRLSVPTGQGALHRFVLPCRSVTVAALFWNDSDHGGIRCPTSRRRSMR